MNVRAHLTEITKNARCQLDIDVIVARAGGLGNLFRTEFPGIALDEFMYEWESRKLAFSGRMTQED